MKKAFVALFSLVLSGCAILQPTTINRSATDDIKNYQYFYINSTGGVKTGSSSYVVDFGYTAYVGTNSKRTDPSDIISGYLMKKGYIAVAQIDEDIAAKTLVVSYGETGRRNAGLGYTIQVTIQFSSALTHNLVCTVSGEGQGETEADDIRIAINRCLDTVFGVPEN